MADKPKFDPVFAENRKARHDFTVLETIECGIVLSGTEVKSVRHGSVSLSGSYGAVLRGELWLVGCDIAAYKFGNRFNHEPKSMRKLLVHAKEVEDLRLKTEAKGLTLIPLKVYLKRGRPDADSTSFPRIPSVKCGLTRIFGATSQRAPRRWKPGWGRSSSTL